MVDPGLVASVGNFSEAAAMTFGIPIGTLVVGIAIGFYHRKPLPSNRRAPLFPLSGIPQRSYDLAIVAAMSKRDRRHLAAHHESFQPGGERPVGGS